MFTFEEVQKVDPEVAAAIAQENDRQQSHLELIASENIVTREKDIMVDASMLIS